jgi:hypothetical protein
MSPKIISHRGNIYGPDKKNENTPSQILLAIQKGFDVEIDFWAEDNRLFLGHDYPEYEIPISFLRENQEHLWIHCKSLDAIDFLKHFLPSSNFFWHQNDDFTLTSLGYIWTYPGKETTEYSVIVDLREYPELSNNVFGVCTDYPERVLND